VAGAKVDGKLYGIPFAGDSQVLTYRTDIHSVPPFTWSELLNSPGNFLFPANDPKASFTLMQYLALGGKITDEEGKPTLEVATLEEVFSFIQSLSSSGILTPTSLQHSSAQSTWSVFDSGRVATSIALFSDYFREYDPENSAAIAIPTQSGGYALARSWCWALPSISADRSPFALELLQWLTEDEFLGSWTLAMGMLPTSQPTLTVWPETSTTATASQLVTVSQSYPSDEVIDIIGPPLLDATRSVMLEIDTPEAASANAVATINVP
jgi:ABC-type glycerol-3-phosphate transport system substrate-binding protein